MSCHRYPLIMLRCHSWPWSPQPWPRPCSPGVCTLNPVTDTTLQLYLSHIPTGALHGLCGCLSDVFVFFSFLYFLPLIFLFLCLCPPLIGVTQALCFQAVICECFRACVCACILLTRYLTNQWTKFLQTLVDDVVEATYELIRFSGSRGQGQGHSKVRHLSELLQRAEASTLTLGRQRIISFH